MAMLSGELPHETQTCGHHDRLETELRRGVGEGQASLQEQEPASVSLPRRRPEIEGRAVGGRALGLPGQHHASHLLHPPFSLCPRPGVGVGGGREGSE